jgi:hypothetical protein
MFYEICIYCNTQKKPSSNYSFKEDYEMVRLAGLEPVRLSAPDPKSGASTNFATGATNGRTHSAIPGSGVQD